MNFLKKISGSALVEKIMIVVFSLAAGSAVISFLIGQIKEAQNVEVDVGLISENLEDNVDDDPVGFQELEGDQFHYHYITDSDVQKNFYPGGSILVNSIAEEILYGGGYRGPETKMGYMYIFMDDPDSLNFYNAFVEFAKDPRVDLSDGEFFIFIVEEEFSEYREKIAKNNSNRLAQIYFGIMDLETENLDPGTNIEVGYEFESTITKQTFLDAYKEIFS